MSIAVELPIESVGERRARWRREERVWRENIEDVSRKTRSLALETGSLDDLQRALLNFRAGEDSDHDKSDIDVAENLSRAFDSLVPFATAIHCASQLDKVSALIWSGLLSVIERGSVESASESGKRSATASRIVSRKVIDLLVDFCESIPYLPQQDKTVYQFTGVQYAFEDLFDAYMQFCIDMCIRLKPSYEPEDVFSRKPKGMLESAKSRIGRHVARLRDAIVRGVQLLQAKQEVAIAQMVPVGITDMPRDMDKVPTKASTVEFPVNTVTRNRNSAFVGREDLLYSIAEKINKGEPAGKTEAGPSGIENTPSRSPTVSPPRFLGSPSGSDNIPTGLAVNGENASVRSGSTNHSKPQTWTTSPTICVLHGLGGVGKTQLAAEYYYEHRGEYDATFWMEAEHDVTLSATFGKIADELELLDRKTTDDGGHEVLNKAIEESRKWLQATEHRWLLIFDNVEDFGEIGQYIPIETHSNGTILITTQSPTIPAGIDHITIQVKTLDPDTAADCIFKYLDREPKDDDEREVACQLAEHVGCLPLAMATIGGYVKQSQISLKEFFDNITHKATLWKKAPRVKDTQQYERSLETVFQKAFKDLTPAARELLNILAFLDPDSVPEEIFIRAIENKHFNNILDKDDYYDCYFELRNRQLIRRDTSDTDSWISIHRVVQWNLLLILSIDYNERWECFKQAFQMVKTMLPTPDPKVIPEANVWPPYAKHGRQILELRTHCLWPEPPVQLPLSFAQILAEMGTYMWFSGKFPEGEKALETAENILNDNNAKYNDGLRAHIHATLGIITSFEGVSERTKSMEFRKSAYYARRHGDIGQKTEAARSRDENMIYWNMHSDMAFGFIQQEDFKSTARYMEECWEQYQKWSKEEMDIPYEYSKYYQLISFCHMADQRPEDAIKAITRCHELMQEAAGQDHPMSQLIKFCLANLLWHSGGQDARDQALLINKAVLEHRRKILGEFSQFTLESYSTCGKLCYDAGEIAKAKEYLEICLQRRKRAVWGEEGITRALFRYSQVLRSLAKEALDGNEELQAEEYNADAKSREREVYNIVQRYRENYDEYMPLSEDMEQNLDQMVSIWAGRFTGDLKQMDKLKQVQIDMSVLDDALPKLPEQKAIEKSTEI